VKNLDTILAHRVLEGTYIRVGVVGAGTMARMIIRHLSTSACGIRLCAIANRTRTRAEQLSSILRIDNVRHPRSVAELDQVVHDGETAIIEDAMMFCRSESIDVVVEVTGTIEFGAQVTLEAIKHGKHVVLVNAELDSTLGPILKQYADRHSVVITNTDGDEPGVAMTLLRYLRSNGLKTVAAGNLKGIIDRYRTPETQRAFALKHNQDPMKVTSFADGTKLSMEAAVLSNASGFSVGQRGMYGPACTHVNEIAGLLPEEQMLDGGLVDYALGAEPHTGAFVVVHESDSEKQKEMAYFKMGKGPFFVFYTPYHLPQVQITSTIARAVLWHDATVAPMGAPVCEVVAVAKRDLKSGERLDGIGGFMSYGSIENSGVVHDEDLLPMGMSEGCFLSQDVRKDEAIRLQDVEIPGGRLIDKLWAEQKELSLLAAR
jgi:predicted homoserine dehydrogenase-like protein